MGFLNNILKRTYRHWLDRQSDDLAVKVMYFRTFRKFMNMKAPETFNEKLNWRKVHQRDPRYPVFSDKITVKDEIGKLVGEDHIIPTLWSRGKPEDIPFDSLDSPYVVKVNHSSGDNIFVHNRENVDRGAVIASMKRQLAYSHNNLFREWAFMEIPRGVLVERMLFAGNGKPPEDYKFYVFHGEVRIIQLDTGRFEDHRQLYLDRQWMPLPFKKECRRLESTPPKPARLEKLIELAEIIGRQFDFVRVDLFDVEGGIFFGETTFYPGAGDGVFHPEEWDRIIGSYWNIHDQNKS